MSAAQSFSLPSPVPVPLLRNKRQGITQPRITPKVRRAIRDMTQLGLAPEVAAGRHSIAVPAFFAALSQPSVQAIVRAEVNVLKQSARPLAARRIIEIASQTWDLKPALDAAKWLDSEGKDGQHSVNVQVNVQQPGYVIAVDPRFTDIPELQQQPTRLMPSPPKALK